MKIVQSGKKRKAISPVLATVILIAITLIAAIAVAGFVFGLFGSFTSSPNLTATAVTCSISGKDCSVTIQNTGNAIAQLPGACSIGGLPGTFTAVAVPGSSSAVVVCLWTTGPTIMPAMGTSASGSITENTGTGTILVSFAGTWGA
ncbi:MAG: archaellin/type IV pilin N-terminal domain-containing protein [Nitrososphaerales archaeon]|jgi:flagellin-like protein